MSELTLIIIQHVSTSRAQVHADQSVRATGLTIDSLGRVVKKACSVFEMVLYGRARDHPTVCDPERLARLKSDKLRGHINLSQRRENFWSDTEVTSDLSQLELDLLVRCSGLGIERGPLLNEGSKRGILSLHHGYNDLNRGGPVGYWEVHYREPSGITAQILNRELDGGTIISQHMIRSAQAPHLNRSRIYGHTGQVIEHAVGKIAQEEAPVETDLYFKDILKEPKVAQRIQLNARLVSAYTQQLSGRIIRKALRGSRLHRYLIWNVFASTNPKRRFQNWTPVCAGDQLVRDDWIADPFAITVEGKHFLICEHWVMAHTKGQIAACEITDLERLTFGPLNPLITNKKHLSYPYTFERSGHAFVIPENQSDGISLYRLSVGAGEQLEADHDRSLLSGYWVDPSLIRLDDTDYLFVSEGNSSSVLRLFTSADITQSPLTEQPYVSHRN